MTLDRLVADGGLLAALAQAVIVTDLRGEILAWNPAATALYGYAAAEVVGRNIIDVLVVPDDAAGADTIMAKVMAGGTWQGEFVVRRKDGSTFPARVTDTPLRSYTGEIVGVVGVSEDVGEQKLAVTRAADRERRLRLALEAGRLGTWQWDQGSGLVVWDERLEEIYGLAPGGFPGTYDAYLAMLYPAERDEVQATVHRALAEGGRFQVRHRVVWPDGTVRWVEGHGQATVDAAGDVTGATGCSRDVTAAVLGAERAERTRLFTEALAATYTVAEVGEVVRAHVTDVFGVTSGAIVLPDPAGRALLLTSPFGYPEQVVRRWSRLPLDGDLPPAVAVRTGTAQFFPGPAGLLAAHPELAADSAEVGSGALACLPLVAAGTAVGALLLGFGAERAFDPTERALLTALAGQTAQAVERARLVQRLRHICGALQQGLAPDAVPQVPGLELAARYRPGGDELAEVGGDWYDVVVHDDGRVTLVVGDVMGRGVEAAAAMIRLRSAVLAYATDDPDPVRVLHRLDRLVAASPEESFLTVLCALVRPGTGQVELASAGHLPPLLVDPAGVADAVRLAPSPPVGLAVGPRPRAEFTLAPGAVLLAFTDGLVERPAASLDEGTAALAAALAGLAAGGTPLPELLAELFARLAVDASRDDVTAFAVRPS